MQPMIGVFDSGLGGLSVVHEVRAVLPHHDLAYLADSACCPYGPRTQAFVRARALAIGRWLLARGARMLVVACNTASSAALEALRAELPVPVVGMEPGVKPAVAATRVGRIGVLATAGTLEGARFEALVRRFSQACTLVMQPCPGLVERVEAGDLDGPEVRALVQRYVAPLIAVGVDTLVLGCTHYPFLKPLIAAVAGPAVAIIDTGPAVARQVLRVAGQHAIEPGSGQVTCWTTGSAAVVQPVLWRLLGEPVPVYEATLVRPAC